MGEKDDFRSSEADKKAAARHIQEHLGPETRKAGSAAEEKTKKVTGSSDLHEWEVRAGLQHRFNKWQRNAKQLENRLSREQTGLENTNALIQDNEFRTGNSLGGDSPSEPLGTPPGQPLFRSKISEL